MPDNKFTAIKGGIYKILVRPDGSLKVSPGTTGLFPYTFQSTLTVLADLTVGSTNTHKIESAGDVVAYSSDKRLKENIVDISNPLDKIEKLRGVYFTWNKKSVEVGFRKEISTTPEMGMIAQELEKVIPNAVKKAPFDNYKNTKLYEKIPNSRLVKRKTEEEPYKTVQLEKVVPLLIECIKELKKEIKELKESK